MQDKPYRPVGGKKTRQAMSARDVFARRIARRLRAGKNNTNYTPLIIGLTVLASALFLFIIAVSRSKHAPEISAPSQRQAVQPVAAPKKAVAPSEYVEMRPPANLCQDGKQADALLGQAKELMRDWDKTRSQADLKKAKKLLLQAVDMYNKAAEVSPNERYITYKLNQANQLRYFAMKSSTL